DAAYENKPKLLGRLDSGWEVRAKPSDIARPVRRVDLLMALVFDKPDPRVDDRVGFRTLGVCCVAFVLCASLASGREGKREGADEQVYSDAVGSHGMVMSICVAFTSVKSLDPLIARKLQGDRIQVGRQKKSPRVLVPCRIRPMT